MDSHVAGTVALIQSLTLTPTLGGISPVPIPARAVFPYVTVKEIMAIELQSLAGPSNLVKTIMQVECWNKSLEVANSIRYQIKQALMNYSGVAGTLTIVAPINHILDSELYDPTRELYQEISRFLIWW